MQIVPSVKKIGLIRPHAMLCLNPLGVGGRADTHPGSAPSFGGVSTLKKKEIHFAR